MLNLTAINQRGDRISFLPTAWEDINIPAVSLTLGATATGTWTIPGTSLKLRTFANTTAQEIHGSTEIPHSYKEGSDIVPHVHWCPTTTGAGDVKWQLEYAWINRLGTITSSSTITVVSTASGVVGQEAISSFAGISGIGKTFNGRFAFRLFRDPADVADTYGADVAVFDVGIHYEMDTLGSRFMTIK